MDREHQLTVWAADQLQSAGYVTGDDFRLVPASNDASFRRYFRSAKTLRHASAGEQNFIFMDAPPELEDSGPFVAIGRLLASQGAEVPVIHAADLSRGFMMLTDFGGVLLLDDLKSATAAQRYARYSRALKSLAIIQSTPTLGLPVYDGRKLQEEMNLFREWFLEALLGYVPNTRQSDMLNRLYRILIDAALAQPTVFVHRDYHARNLMLISPDHGDPSLGVIDFQDAVKGPVSYDLVSLLRDCYFRLVPDELDRLVADYHRELTSINADMASVALPAFREWFDLMGLQRHLKCAGIFSRLYLRDGKPGYIADIPLVLQYMLEVSESHDALSELGLWLRSDVMPAFNTYLAGFEDTSGANT